MILPIDNKRTDSLPSLLMACAQLNLCAGDIAGNCDKIMQAAKEAYAQGARLLLTPELAISAYASEDLFLRPAFLAACSAALKQLALDLQALPGMVVVVGHPSGHGQRGDTVSTSARHNSASVLQDGQVLACYHKRQLPNYQNFDENRYFVSGQSPCVVRVHGFEVGVLICEDAWFDAPAAETVALGAQVLLLLNASPYHLGKRSERLQRMQAVAQKNQCPLVYAHLVGGQDEFVYDGASFAVDGQGHLQAHAPAFVESLLYLQIHSNGQVQGQAMPWSVGATSATTPATTPTTSTPAGSEPHLTFAGKNADGDECADVWAALVLGLRDYVEKNHFPGVVLGLSGGIDSAVVLSLAVDALGPSRVRAVLMPSPYTADISVQDARTMAKRLGVVLDELSIAEAFSLFKNMLQPIFAGRAEDTTEENLQARIRGILLMALSNKLGYMLLTTGNKSEVAVGYATLYGDMCGGFAPIKDVLKTKVFALARWRNQAKPTELYAGAIPEPSLQPAAQPISQPVLQPIPERIITRPPSAELRPEQTDQDSLPAYDILDAIIARHVEADEGLHEIVAAGFDAELVARVLRLIKISEHKRRQAAPGTRVSPRSFGKDWRFPITNRVDIDLA